MSKKMSFLSRSLNILLMLLIASPYSFASSSKVTSTSNQNTQEQNVAQAVSQTGQTLQDNPTSQGAAALMGSVLSNVANQNIQEQLNRYGNARIQLNVDENFSLKNSQFDLLLPIWEEQENLFFTQGSFHRTDDRNQGNLGLGLRHFSDESMLGINSFFDYDLSRHHSRLGVGLEYWRNYLKLSSNGYIHLSGWKNSTDLANYEERAANGLDMRAEGFLPIYPQIGAKLMYEQYFGDEVALFNKDTREINPYAVTMGVNYTPVPLLTFNVDQRQGKSGQHDTRLGLQMNYQLGQSLDKQLSTDEVSTMRSLAGSRYDFVERNNNIVLEYRKKNGIRLVLVPKVSGYGGEIKEFTARVEASHGFDRIEWDDSALVAAGGKVQQNGDLTYQIELPTYQYGYSLMNTYTVSAIAYDQKGNASDRETVSVEVLETEVSAELSQFVATPSSIVADGQDTSILKLTLKDINGLPILGVEKGLTFPIEVGVGGTSIGAVRMSAAGVYEADLTGNMAGEVIIVPELYGTKLAALEAKVTLTPVVSIVPMKGQLIVNGRNFPTNKGFPTSGFKNAEFKLNKNNLNGKEFADFDIESNQSWVTVQNDTIKFNTDMPSGGNEVVITATPKDGGDILTYTFKIKNWFLNAGNQTFTKSQAEAFCSAQPGGYYLPEEKELTSQYRQVNGALWDEWGVITNYSDAGFIKDNKYYYITPTKTEQGSYIKIEYQGVPYTTMSGISGDHERELNFAVCKKVL